MTHNNPLKTAAVRTSVVALLLCLGLAGCANSPLPSLTTGSLFGSKPDAQAAAAPAVPEIRNDPTSRTLQVSRTAAKAQRCGFHFDAARLKGSFMASEGGQAGADVAELGKLDKVYTGSFNGTTKATTADEAYCSAARTKHIKGELARHLAGDYAPGKAFEDPNADEDGGMFAGSGGLFDPGGPATTYKSPTFSTNNL